MFATVAYGYAKGDPVKLLTPFDSRGNQCGLSNSPTAEFKYLWWPDLYKAVNAKSISDFTKGVLSNSYCVKSCPMNLTQRADCFIGNKTWKSECDVAYFSSYKYLNRYCLPNLSNMTKIT